MKKTLVSALTTALVVGAASTTFAAANPFSPMYRLITGLTMPYPSSQLTASSKATATRRSAATRTSRAMRWLR